MAVESCTGTDHLGCALRDHRTERQRFLRCPQRCFRYQEVIDVLGVRGATCLATLNSPSHI